MAGMSLRNLLSVVQKRFLTTSTALSPLPQPPFQSAEYLMKSCGISLETAVSISSKSQCNEKTAPKQASVINCLKSHGFSDEQIIKLAERLPRSFNFNAEKKLNPKLEFLSQIGIGGTLLAKVIIWNPAIITRSLNSCLKPTIELLRKYLKSDKDLVTAINRGSWLLSADLNGNFRSNVKFLMDQGVSADRVMKLFLSRPRILLLNSRKIAALVESVRKMGLNPEDVNFIHGCNVFCSYSEATLKRKTDLLKTLGWSDEEICVTFRLNPLCFGCSEEKMKRLVAFWRNKMKLEMKDLVYNPKLLMCSSEKRLEPRYDVLKVLQSRNLIPEGMKTRWLADYTDAKFIDRFITKNLNEEPGLLDMYLGRVSREDEVLVEER